MSNSPQELLEAAEFESLLTELKAPTPLELIKQRAGHRDKDGTQNYYDYLAWESVADILDRIYPKWNHEITKVELIGKWFAVIVSIEIAGVKRGGLGLGEAESERGLKKAESDALKRAAKKFGIGRDLAGKGSAATRSGNNEQRIGSYDAPEFPKPSDIIAKSEADLRTPKQLVAINAISNTNAINAEGECLSLLNCRPEELSRKAASFFIDYLKKDPAERLKIKAGHLGENVKPDDADSKNDSESNVDLVKKNPVEEGKRIARLGKVVKELDYYTVTPPGVNPETFEVSRDPKGNVICNCQIFNANMRVDKFRCEHILAVKFHIEPPDDVPMIDIRLIAACEAIARAKALDLNLESHALFQRDVDNLTLNEGTQMLSHLKNVRLQ